jgi:hypothetical protein
MSGNPASGEIPGGAHPIRLADGREILIHLRDGRAWVATMEGGRAKLSPMSAWLAVDPGGGRALRSLAVAALAAAVGREVARRARGLFGGGTSAAARPTRHPTAG